MQTTTIPVKDMLPHDYPMIFIDKVIEYDFKKNYFLAKTKIKESMPFYNKKIAGISPLAGIEFMAQAAGCFSYLKSGIKKPRLGFLLGSRLYNNAVSKFEIGKEYFISVKEIFADGTICSFDCQIFDDRNEEVACATINAYQPDNLEETLRYNE